MGLIALRKTGNMILSVVFIVLGILMFVFTGQFPYNGLTNFGAGFWPRIIATLMIICSLLDFITSMLSKDPKMLEVIIDWKSAGMKRVYATAVVLILFCVLVHFFGLLIGLLWMIFGVMFTMGERRIPMLVVTPIVMTLFVFVAFQVLLKVQLPTGTLL